jgi:uncharacterized membrane protein YbhN (UPF0104 family)
MGESRNVNPAPAAASQKSRNRKWQGAVLVVLAAGFALWIASERWWNAHFDWPAFAASFLKLDWRWVMAAAALGLLSYYGRALRWAVMLKPLRPQASVWGLFEATAIGFMSIVLLGRPGEFVRPYLISIKERVPFSSQMAAWFLERICDLLAVLVLFGIALTQIDSSRAGVSPKLAWIFETGGYMLGIVGALCVVILVMLGRFSGTMRKRLLDGLSFLPPRYHEKTDRIVTAFIDGTAAMQDNTSAFRLFFYTVAEWTLIVLCFLALFRAYGPAAPFGLRDVLIFQGFVSFGSILQIPGLGGGVQIASIVVLTEMFHLPLALATGMAIMIWFVSFLVIVPPGVLLACHEGLNWRKLRELKKQAEACAGPAAAAPGAESEGI